MTSTVCRTRTETLVIPEWLKPFVTKALGHDCYRIDDEMEFRICQWHDTMEVVAFYISCERNSRLHYCEGHRQQDGKYWTFKGEPLGLGMDTKWLRILGQANQLMADIVDAYEKWLSDRPSHKSRVPSPEDEE